MSVNANTGISHLYSKPFDFAASRAKALRRLTFECTKEPVATVATTHTLARLKIEAVPAHPLDFFKTLKETTYPMTKALYAYVCKELGKKDSQNLEFFYVSTWLSSHSKSEAIKEGMDKYWNWLDPECVDERVLYEALSTIFDMFVIVEEKGGIPATYFKLEELHALINTIIRSNSNSDKEQLIETVEVVGRELFYIERYCQEPPETQKKMLHEIFNYSFSLLRDHHPQLEGDVRCKNGSWEKLNKLFSLGERKANSIDFFVYDEGMGTFLNLLEIVTELDIPNVSNLISADFLKETREQYLAMTSKPRIKSLALQFSIFISE